MLLFWELSIPDTLFSTEVRLFVAEVTGMGKRPSPGMEIPTMKVEGHKKAQFVHANQNDRRQIILVLENREGRFTHGLKPLKRLCTQ